jgi:hypothetical protein
MSENINKALLSQLAVIAQVMSVIRLTGESLLEPDDFEVAATRARDALNGVHALLDSVLGHLEEVGKLIRGEPASGSSADLDKLSGYSGSIQGTPLETALDEQREALWLARSIVDTTTGSLEREFGKDWPAKLPEFPRALREVSRLVNTIAGNLESAVLEDRALEIGRAVEVET